MSKPANHIHLKALTWNIGFGSLKKEHWHSDEATKIKNIQKTIQHIQPDVVTFQEIANRTYLDAKAPFQFLKQLKETDQKIKSAHFESTLFLGSKNSFPFGKIEQLQLENIRTQETGIGIIIRNENQWKLTNLYTNIANSQSKVEVQNSLPSPLYMGDDRNNRAGRDEESRPVLWSRIQHPNLPPDWNVFFTAVHFPTLKGEEKSQTPGLLTNSQENIFENVLNLPSSRRDSITIDELGTELRLFMLRQIVFQMERLESFWKSESPNARCIFLLAGDFNFYHYTDLFQEEKPEFTFLKKNGFSPTKRTGYTRTKNRTHDNIWVSLPELESHQEILVSEMELPTALNDRFLFSISDHLPVVCELSFQF